MHQQLKQLKQLLIKKKNLSNQEQMEYLLVVVLTVVVFVFVVVGVPELSLKSSTDGGDEDCPVLFEMCKWLQ